MFFKSTWFCILILLATNLWGCKKKGNPPASSPTPTYKFDCLGKSYSKQTSPYTNLGFVGVEAVSGSTNMYSKTSGACTYIAQLTADNDGRLYTSGTCTSTFDLTFTFNPTTEVLTSSGVDYYPNTIANALRANWKTTSNLSLNLKPLNYNFDNSTGALLNYAGTITFTSAGNLQVNCSAVFSAASSVATSGTVDFSSCSDASYDGAGLSWSISGTSYDALTIGINSYAKQ